MQWMHVLYIANKLASYIIYKSEYPYSFIYKYLTIVIALL